MRVLDVGAGSVSLPMACSCPQATSATMGGDGDAAAGWEPESNEFKGSQNKQKQSDVPLLDFAELSVSLGRMNGCAKKTAIGDGLSGFILSSLLLMQRDMMKSGSV